MKVSENFILQEFVPKELYSVWGERSIWFIDPKVINICQYLREKVGKPLTINNWHKGGNFNESGFRMPDTKTGGKLSQHKFGRAADPKGVEPAKLLEIVQDNWNELKALGLTTIEDISYTKTWFHIDTRQTNLDDLLIVKP